LPLFDQGVTIAVRYDRNFILKEPPVAAAAVHDPAYTRTAQPNGPRNLLPALLANFCARFRAPPRAVLLKTLLQRKAHTSAYAFTSSWAETAPTEELDVHNRLELAIRNWLAQCERNAGRGDGGLATAEREELSRLRRENRQLRLEREILSKAAAWFARETNAIPHKGSSS